MLKNILTICFLVWIPLLAAGQKLSDIKLDKLYTGPLPSVIKSIAAEHPVQFDYEASSLEKFIITRRPFMEPLDKFLDKVLPPHGLHWMSTPDGTIAIFTEEDYARRKATGGINTRSYQGPATKTNLSLSGRVFDKTTGETLPFVSILVHGTTIGTTSNVDGYFSLLKVPSDTSTLIFSYIGYTTEKVFLSPDLNLEHLEVNLETTGTILDAVVVTSERQDLMRAGDQVSKLRMTPDKLAALPNIGERDVFRSFQLMPGISAANEHTSGLYVRGGTPDQALTLFDGFTVYNVDHLFGFFSAFNANAIKDVQLYKGAFDAKYGGRLSSVVEITGKDGNSKAFNIGGDLSFLSANGFVEAPLGNNISAIVTARRSWRGPLYETIFDSFSGEGETANPLAAQFGSSVSSYFYDLNGKVTWRPSPKDVVSLSIYNGQDKLDNSINPELPAFLDAENFSLNITDLTTWGNTGSSLRWGRQWNDRLYSNTLISTSSYFSNRNRSLENSITTTDGESQNIQRGTLEDSDLIDYSVKSDWEWQLTPQNKIEFGAFLTWNDIAYTYAQNDTTDIINRQTEGITTGLFLQTTLSADQDRLQITPGIRTSFFEPTQEVYFEPRLNFSYTVSERLKLKGSVGRYFQFAKRVIREDILEGSRDFWVLADNDRLPVSQNDQIILGFSYETKDWLFDVEGYTKNLSGLSEYSLRFTPSLGEIGVDENFLIGTGTARGIDFLLQKKYGKWNGWAGYTIGEVRNNFPEFGENDFYAANDVTHEFKLVNLLRLGRWQLSATWIYASGRPFTAPEGGYQIDLLDGSTANYLTVGSKNGRRLPDYHRLDLGATLQLGKASPTSLGISLFNLYGRQNVWYKTFEIVEDTVIPVDVNYLGFTPNLTFSWRLR
jgi:ferric enterobactin receptor